MAKLRLYCDFQTATVDGWNYILLHENRRIDEVASSLGLYEGMAVTLYEDDEPGEQIECEGILSFRSASPAPGTQWMALAQQGTFRRIATGAL